MRYGRGREAHPKVPDRLGISPKRPGGIGKPTWRSRSGRESHPEVREESEGPPGGS